VQTVELADGTVAMRATLSLVCVCATRFRPMGIPPDLRSALESWTLPADGTAGPGPRPDNGTGSTG
jgi:hypothetical protein